PQDGHADAAGLRGERDPALDVVRRAERRTQILGGVVVAVDVRAEQPHAVLPRDADGLLLQLDVARLGEPGRNQHGRRDVLLAYLAQGLGHELRRHREYRDVHVARYVADLRVGLAAEDLLRLGVDRVNLARVTPVDQV